MVVEVKVKVEEEETVGVVVVVGWVPLVVEVVVVISVVVFGPLKKLNYDQIKNVRLRLLHGNTTKKSGHTFKLIILRIE